MSIAGETDAIAMIHDRGGLEIVLCTVQTPRYTLINARLVGRHARQANPRETGSLWEELYVAVSAPGLSITQNRAMGRSRLSGWFRCMKASPYRESFPFDLLTLW